MANFRLPNATRTACVEVIDGLIDSGGAGTIEIYGGGSGQPASANTAVSDQTLLAVLTFSATSKSSESNGVLTFAAITADSSANATGTAGWARIKSGGGATVFDCDVGTSGATINLNTTSITAGSNVAITSFTVTVPAGA